MSNRKNMKTKYFTYVIALLTSAMLPIHGATTTQHKADEGGARGANPNLDGPKRDPFWSDSFTYHGLEYKYKMVGSDPKEGSRSSIA